MATPTENFVPTSLVDGSTSPIGQYLITGTKWGGAMGTGVTMTWSLPSGTNPPHAQGADYSDANEWSGFRALTATEGSEVRKALGIISNSANVTFVQVDESSTSVGEIRYGYSSVLGADAAAYAYDPGDYVAAGDVWLNPTGFNAERKSYFEVGSYDPLVLMHETMHALGIKHPFADAPIIPAGKDNFFYTIMSYTAAPGLAQGDNYATYYPTTPMFYDLVALEALYGRSTRANIGDTVYRFYDGTRYWQTINDISGTDIVVYNGSENSSINLNPGTFSALSEAIAFSDGTTSRATVSIGPSALIENATGGSGADTLTGNDIANTLQGNAGADVLFGNGGNDFLDGGAGNDRMAGGTGHDFYRVDASEDVVIEAAGGGVDHVRSSVSFTLSGHVESLLLLGSGNLAGIGNALANTLTGNAGANILNGLGGADRLTGGGGNDLYVVDTPSDVIVEQVGGGVDRVFATSSYILSAEVETLSLFGAASINGAGNAAANVLAGNSGGNVLFGNGGNDRLNGLSGNDHLVGGAGRDVFVFTTKPGAGNVDTISDFSVVDDIIHLENAIFTALGQTGQLVADLFWSSTSGVAHDANDRIVYDTDGGGLFYDDNGNVAGGAVQFAQLSANLSLTGADFMVI